MAITQEERLSTVICRRAQEITAELEELPMETHQAIVSTMATLFQHRGMREQRRLQEKPQFVGAAN